MSTNTAYTISLKSSSLNSLIFYLISDKNRSILSIKYSLENR